jgi:hypothetical protein
MPADTAAVIYRAGGENIRTCRSAFEQVVPGGPAGIQHRGDPVVKRGRLRHRRRIQVEFGVKSAPPLFAPKILSVCSDMNRAKPTRRLNVQLLRKPQALSCATSASLGNSTFLRIQYRLPEWLIAWDPWHRTEIQHPQPEHARLGMRL